MKKYFIAFTFLLLIFCTNVFYQKQKHAYKDKLHFVKIFSLKNDKVNYFHLNKVFVLESCRKEIVEVNHKEIQTKTLKTTYPPILHPKFNKCIFEIPLEKVSIYYQQRPNIIAHGGVEFKIEVKQTQQKLLIMQESKRLSL